MNKPGRDILFPYIGQTLKNKGCFVFIIGGVEDHLHILTNIHQSASVSQIIADLKRASSVWIKENKVFPEFRGWQVGYSAFTVYYKNKDILIRYIENQEEHHRKEPFIAEYTRLLEEFDMEYKEEYLWV
jgi:REP-associated tyrosine transposase